MKTQLKKHTTEQKKKGKKKVGGEGGSAGKAEKSKPCTQQEGGKEKEGMINPELPGETKKKNIQFKSELASLVSAKAAKATRYR